MTALLACPVAALVVWAVLSVANSIDRADRHHNEQEQP